ncbi:MAG: HNH endonuclease [Firmicutes bacterium ADurb.Bin146]|nr:MAG: HNH endonuclease [Firmicutes bacterium ADurb.Bin146]
MPRKPKHPCAYPGCPNLTDEQYCEKHKAEVQRDYDRYTRAPDVHKKYGRAWKRIRDSYAKAHPLCERCLEEGRITPMDEVHHIVPISQGGTHARSNLRSLCKSCHQRTHIELGDRHMDGQ